MRHPHYHVEGDMLLAYAAGTLSEGGSLLVAAHLSLCCKCRASLAAAEAVGGALLEDMAPEPVCDKAFETVLARLDDSDISQTAPAPCAGRVLGVQLPSAVRRYLPTDLSTIEWQHIAPGLKTVQLLNSGAGVTVGLFHCQAGTALLKHDHVTEEASVVLAGGYSDESGTYGAGDFQTIEPAFVHTPLIDPDKDCVSLVLKGGPLKLAG